MTLLLFVTALAVYAAFWARIAVHALIWCRARLRSGRDAAVRTSLRSSLLAAADVALFARLFLVNPALWIGEWLFHCSFLLVLARHLRYFLDPVPDWVWSLQTPGLIAGYVLPLSLLYILVVRLLGTREKYTSRLNVLLLSGVLLISVLGILMHWRYKPDLVSIKSFVIGILGLSPASAPDSTLFLLHFGLVLALVPLLPTHIFAAPFVMIEARKQESALSTVLHD